ncbi:hypothetical protein [Absidia glauca]|uniref:PHD-type domain-containing protein n=1 Tax=Absidia glauca TaxID=4829 RepID=A0A168Q499_ABSGL|nr:hypothetical protein [Absidia glauca]
MSTYISSLSTPDLSQHLSEGSTLSPESDHSQGNQRHHSTPTPSMADKKKKKPSKPKKSTTATTITLPAPTHSPKKNAKQVKEEPLYCTCRQGYDGKQFMIACDSCHEWFHGRCVGISPKSVIKNYYCDTCQAKPTKKKAASQDTPTVKTANGKGQGKKANAKKATTTSSRKKSTPKTNTSASDPSPSAPSPSQQTITSTTITTNAAQDDDEDEDLDDICPICEFECTCGTSSSSAPVAVSAPPPTPVVVTSNDTPTKPSPTPRKGTIKKQPKKQSAKSRKGKSAKKATHFTPLSDDEDVDILEDDDDDFDDYDNNLLSAALDDDGDSLVMDPFSSDEELSDDDVNSDFHMGNLSPYPDSQLGSYSSSIHIDSGDDAEDEDIEQEEERAIIAEMMEHEGLPDNPLDDKALGDGENGGYFIEDEDSEDLDDYDMDDDSSDASDDGDGDSNNVDGEDDEAHAYYLRTNGLWASSEEEDDDEDDEDHGFHSDPGPMHDAPSDDDDPTDLVALLGSDSVLFNNIAEAFMQVLAPLTDTHHAHSDGITPTNGTTPTATTSTVTPISALSALNVATFDLGSNAAACLNSAPTSPTGHRLDDYLRRPSLPSNALLAAAHGHREMDLASDALSALSSVLSAEALGLSLHPTPASIKETSPAKLAKDESGELESAATMHGQQQKQLSAPDLSTASSSSSSSSSPPATSVYDSAPASASITPPDNTESLPPSPTPCSSQQSTALDISSSLTSPNSPQPSYDLASLLPPDMKIPEQLLELIKSSLAASINDKDASPASSPTTSTAAKPSFPSSSSSSSSSSSTATKTAVSSSTLARQLLPKPTTDGPPIETSTENDKKRPLSIVS